MNGGMDLPPLLTAEPDEVAAAVTSFTCAASGAR